MLAGLVAYCPAGGLVHLGERWRYLAEWLAGLHEVGCVCGETVEENSSESRDCLIVTGDTVDGSCWSSASQLCSLCICVHFAQCRRRRRCNSAGIAMCVIHVHGRNA